MAKCPLRKKVNLEGCKGICQQVLISCFDWYPRLTLHQSILDWHSMNTSIDTWLTLDQHLGQQSVESWLNFADALCVDRFVWVGRQLTDYQPTVSEVLIGCWWRFWLSVNQALIVISIKCQSRVTITTPPPLVCMICQLCRIHYQSIYMNP